MGDRSRYGEFVQRSLRPMRRGKQVRGSEDDYGVYWKCQLCNATNNIHKRPITDYPSYSGSEAQPIDDIVLNGSDNFVMEESGRVVSGETAGRTFFEYHVLGMDYHTNCWFCGAKYR